MAACEAICAEQGSPGVDFINWASLAASFCNFGRVVGSAEERATSAKKARGSKYWFPAKVGTSEMPWALSIRFSDGRRDTDTEGGELDDNIECVESERDSTCVDCLDEAGLKLLALTLRRADGSGNSKAASITVSTGEIGSITLKGGGDGVL